MQIIECFKFIILSTYHKAKYYVIKHKKHPTLTSKTANFSINIKSNYQIL